ncbi:MAG: YihY/virulence factor BrkB family protein, partial [Thermoleophilia bacterium]|nr:YihY/virulence factor BrkB family protein [Thermoleophilia bacterium]
MATVRHALADNVSTLAGAPTYSALLSLFPALIVIVGILTLAGREATGGVLVDVLEQLLPAEAAQALEDPVERLVADPAGAGALLGV